MAHTLQLILLFHFPTMMFLFLFSASWFFSKFLTPRACVKKGPKHPQLHCYGVLFLLNLPAPLLFQTPLHAWYLQLALLVGVLLLFQDSLKRKLAFYIFFVFIFLTIEAASFTLFTAFYYLKNGVLLSAFHMEDLKTAEDILLITFCYFLAALPIFWKVPQILSMYLQNPFSIMEIIFPVQLVSLLQIIPMQQTSQTDPTLVIVYWLLCLLCYIPVIHGMRGLYEYEKSQAFLSQKVDILRTQLDYSHETQQQYQVLRKWNHDIENHLFALSYLTNNGKYKEAADYLDSIELGEKPNDN